MTTPASAGSTASSAPWRRWSGGRKDHRRSGLLYLCRKALSDAARHPLSLFHVPRRRFCRHRRFRKRAGRGPARGRAPLGVPAADQPPPRRRTCRLPSLSGLSACAGGCMGRAWGSRGDLQAADDRCAVRRVGGRNKPKHPPRSRSATITCPAPKRAQFFGFSPHRTIFSLRSDPSARSAGANLPTVDKIPTAPPFKIAFCFIFPRPLPRRCCPGAGFSSFKPLFVIGIVLALMAVSVSDDGRMGVYRLKLRNEKNVEQSYRLSDHRNMNCEGWFQSAINPCSTSRF